MTQEEKQLLLKDLCGRLPYGVKVTCFKNGALTPYLIDFRDSTIHATSDFSGTYIKVQLEDCKIYLRPMSSMTEEEKMEVTKLGVCYDGAFHNDIYDIGISMGEAFTAISWLLERHFDINYLIEKGLALEAPEDMYK